MANTFAPFGFRQYRGNGSAPTYEQVATFCAYDTAAMYYGDPVFRNTTTGGVYPTTPGANVLAGVFAGCKYLSVSQKRTVWSNFWGAADVASGNLVEVYVVNDPNAQFLAQVGGSSSVGAVAGQIGANVQFAYGTPSTASGISGVSLVANPPGSNGTEAGAYNYVIVAFNNVETKTLTGV